MDPPPAEPKWARIAPQRIARKARISAAARALIPRISAICSGVALLSRATEPNLLSSTALRAKTTAKALVTQLKTDPGEITLMEALYGAGVGTLSRVVAAIADSGSFAAALLVAHNPGMHDFANHLIGKWKIDRYVTCAVAHLELDIEHWGEVEKGCAKLKEYFTPKQL